MRSLSSLPITIRFQRWLILLPLMSLPSLAADDGPNDRTAQVMFCAMGDVPYASAEDVLLPKQIAGLPQDAEFVIHVGDIKGGQPPCHEAVYVKVSGMLRKSEPPVLIIPGDNEWNDCVDPDPDQAWQYWTKYFMRLDRHWKHQLPVFRQLEREENFSFVQNGVLFIGLNIVGGRVHDAAEWKLRHAQCLTWVRRNLREIRQFRQQPCHLWSRNTDRKAPGLFRAVPAGRPGFSEAHSVSTR